MTTPKPKILGFRAEDVKQINVCDDAEIVKEPVIRYEAEIYASELVPVRPAAESISLRELEKFCKEYGGCYFKHTGKKQDDLVLISELLTWARQQAKKEE